MDKVKQFLETVKKDPKARELIKKLKKPKDDQEAAEGYFEIAQALNCDITKEEIAEGLKGAEQALKEKAAQVAEQVAVSDEELDQVAGGGDGEGQVSSCDSSYSPGEWCWFSDSCAFLINDYEHYGYDPEGARDSFNDPQPGDENYEIDLEEK